SRAGADQLTVTNGAFDLAQLLRGAAVAFRPLSERHTLTADIPDDLPQAYGDMTATDVIVGQLLENAYKYSPGGGAVPGGGRPAGGGGGHGAAAAVRGVDRGHRRRRGDRHRTGRSRAHLRALRAGRGG